MKRSLILSSLLCGLLGGCWYKSFKLDPSLDPSGTGGKSGGGGQGGTAMGQGGEAPMVLTTALDQFVIDQGATLDLGNVLDNDSGSGLTVTAIDDTDAGRPSSIDADTLTIAADGTILFVPNPDFFGIYRLSYSVSDANGKTALGAVQIRVRPKHIRLSLIADGYGGFVIDGAAGDALGTSVSRAGDINKDGIADFIVGAPRPSATGYAAIIYGKKSPKSFATSDPSITGKATLLVGELKGQTGYSVSSAGDQNGDGSPDVILGAPGETLSPGSAYVVFGKLSLGTSVDITALSASGGYRLDGWTSAQMGKVVAGGADLNGDGKPDLLVSGNHTVSAEDNAGSVSAIFGPGAVGAAASQIDLTINGFNPSGRIDKDVATLGDIDGDNRDDIAIIGLQDTLVLLGINPTADTPSAWPTTPNAVGAGKTSYGYKFSEGALTGQLSGVGDFNKDGTADLVYCASASSCSFVVGKSDLNLTTSWDINGLTSAPKVDGNGDLNGDGFSDFVLADSSRAYVVLGREAVPTSALSVLSLTKNEYEIEAEASTSIAEVAVIGDINDDGLDDLAVATPARSGQSGRVYVIFGQ